MPENTAESDRQCGGNTNRIVTGDCFDVLDELPESSVHAVVTDPPYFLGDSGFMGREWDDFSDSRQYQEWCREWAELCRRVLKPGGHLLAFGGNTRHHRLNCGVEDAGFEIRDQLTWHFSEGFPKASDISKTIDKRADAEREVVGEKDHTGAMSGSSYDAGDRSGSMDAVHEITTPATDTAKKWDGFKTGLKPATEFVVMARKPFDGATVDCVLEHGTGALNVDATRVRTNDSSQGRASSCPPSGGHSDADNTGHTNQTHDARVLLRTLRTSLSECGVDHPCLQNPSDVEYAQISSLVEGSLSDCQSYHRFCDVLFRHLSKDGQAPGSLQNGVRERTRRCSHWDDLASEEEYIPLNVGTLHHGPNPASEMVESLVNLINEYATQDVQSDGRKTAKRKNSRSLELYSGGDDGSEHGEVVTTDADPDGRYPANVVFDATEAERLDQEVGDTTEHNGESFAGQTVAATQDTYGDYDGERTVHSFNDSGGPSRYFYTSKASRAERTLDGRIENAHPTVKPQDLMEWLVKLVTAEGQTVVDPFAGSGTTCKAAKDLSREFVGVERQAKWADVARVRCGLTPEDPSRVRDDDAQQGLEEFCARADGGGRSSRAADTDRSGGEQ